MKNHSSILWVCDPIQKSNYIHSTTYRLIEESFIIGHDNWICDSGNISFIENTLYFKAKQILSITKGTKKYKLQFSGYKMERIICFSKIFFRADLPFSINYINKIQLINCECIKLGLSNRVINDPSNLALYNSKNLNLFFPEYAPNQIISASWKELKSFVKRNEICIQKSLNDGCGRNVNLVKWIESKNDTAYNKLKLETNNFTSPILLQEYLDIKNNGEIRLWFANGEIISVIKKNIGEKARFKFNLDYGDTIEKYILNLKEQKIALKISMFLKSHSITLAAIDLIDGKIIDFNIASPGLIVEMELIWSENIAKKIINLIIK